MGIILEKKERRGIEEGKKVIFNLLAEPVDLQEGNNEGYFQCYIRIFNDKDKIIGDYCRNFLVKDFNLIHYKKFIDKFCRDVLYREQFNEIKSINKTHQ
jgi:hypothetical protein